MKLDSQGRAMLEGDGEYGFDAVIDGDDLLLQESGGGLVEASFFGGTQAEDPGDNGQTASGAVTRNPDGSEHEILGYSLPHDPREAATAGSPIPYLGYHPPVMVRVYCPATGKTVEAPVIDDGPSEGTYHAIDCTREAFAQLGGDYEAGLIRVDVRILGGALHLPAAVLVEAAALVGAWKQAQHDAALASMGQ